ncbi:protein LURP-one-related 11-like [Apium graveolens]|uniref:protein LURP-one-related 11-like n=1 Tax=Apium graveolens TaxID=4045 RepID=UPI003D7951D4
MAKVYPCKASPSISTCSPQTSSGKTYTIWMKSLVANGNGFTVYDSFGKVVYRIDNYNNKCSRQVYLMDLHGNVLFSMFQKKLFGFGQWNGYRTDVQVKNDKPYFEVHNTSKVLKRKETEYHVNMGCDGTSFYKIKGMVGKSEFKITDKQERVLAEVKQKQSSSGVLLGQDVLSLKLEPLVDDDDFIMALVAVHGLLTRKM